MYGLNDGAISLLLLLLFAGIDRHFELLPGLFKVEVVVAKLRKVDILVRHDN